MSLNKHLFLAFLFVFTVSATSYAMITTLPLEELVKKAQVILIATAEEVRISDQANGSHRAIENQLNISSLLKGALEKPDFAISTIQGLEDEPVFIKSAKYLLFLTKIEGKVQTVNGIQGCWPIGPEGQLGGMGRGKSIEEVKEVINGAKETETPLEKRNK